MARRATIVEPEFERDPVDDVIREDRAETANELSTAIESMRGYDAGSIKGILFKVPKGGGKYETIETIFPPFDFDKIIEDLKERFGGGDYLLRIMEIGKPGVKKNINFSIAQERNPLIAPREDKTDLTMMMFQMMMKQSEDAARQRADDMRDRQAASERQMQMMTTLASALIPAMFGGREKTSELMTAIAAFQPKPQENDLEKTVNTFAALKTIFKDDAPAATFDPSDMVGSLVKAAGPIAGAVGRAFSGGRSGQAPATEAPQYEADAEPLRIPSPNPTPALEHRPEPSKYPILDLIRPDVLYHFGRRNNPEFAAEGVYDILLRANVSEDEINALVAVFSISGDRWGDLAAQGIDLRADLPWADAFLAELVRLHAKDRGDGDDSAG